MKKVLLSLMIAAGLAFAGGVSQNGKAGDLDVTITTDKALFVGTNDFKIKVTKGGKEVKDASVKLKLFMPAMPGMPGMGEEIEAKPTADGYDAKASFSMNGGWQVTTTIAEKGGKAKKYRFNVNL
jgi:YtkA-like